MPFVKIPLSHNETINWDKITHVRIVSEIGDTKAGQAIIDHIKMRGKDKIASLASIKSKFPLAHPSADKTKGMLHDLRHMANDRNSGTNPQNKGKLELGYIQEESNI